MLPQAERSSYARQLLAAEESARGSRKKVWENYVEPTEEEEEGNTEEATEEKDEKRVVNGESTPPVERKVDYKKVRFYARMTKSCYSFE